MQAIHKPFFQQTDAQKTRIVLLLAMQTPCIFHTAPPFTSAAKYTLFNLILQYINL